MRCSEELLKNLKYNNKILLYNRNNKKKKKNKKKLRDSKMKNYDRLNLEKNK